jgi:hypothetical protein
MQKAEVLFALLKSLCFDLAKIEPVGYNELRAIVEQFANFAESALPVHQTFWDRNEEFVLKLFDGWTGDVSLLIKVLEPYSRDIPGRFDGHAAGNLHKKLCGVALPKFAQQISSNLRDSGFIRRMVSNPDDNSDSRHIIWDKNGIFGKTLRKSTLTLLEEASSNRTIQDNAYELLHWFCLAHATNFRQDYTNIKKTLSEQAIFDAMWKAATPTPLGLLAIHQIRELPNFAQQIEIKFEPPDWWKAAATNMEA